MQNISGIYKITNKINGHIYVGQTVNLKRRKRIHFYKLKRGEHHNIYLQRSYNKYGENNFLFEIILYCDVDNLTYYEQQIVDFYHPEYNICKLCVKSKIGIQSPKTVDKINKNKNRKLNRAKLPPTQYGNPLSDIAKRKMKKTLDKKFFFKRLKKKILKPLIKIKKLLYKRKKNKRICAAIVGRKLSQETKDKIAKSRFLKKEKVIRIKESLDNNILPKDIATLECVNIRTIYKVKNGYYKNIYNV